MGRGAQTEEAVEGVVEGGQEAGVGVSEVERGVPSWTTLVASEG